MDKVVSTISMRPITFFILLTIVVILLPCIAIPYWYTTMKNLEENVSEFRNMKLISDLHKHVKVALILLILMMVALIIFIITFVALIVRASRREVHLCDAYIKQMEQTSQAERKSMKQSLAFASANHDVRGYLACIKGLIELCLNDVASTSELASNLRKINDSAEELLGLINSILDFSKIEAGKMQLEDKEFDMAQLLEDIADFHYPVAMKKGLDVILDTCEGSITKFSKVRGDQVKLKQILHNLLSNALKFTSEGHISIRARAKKLSFENSIIASNNSSNLNKFSRFFYKNKQVYDGLEKMRSIKQDPNCMEFQFEVEDTGSGIPRNKRQSIFENFVQVKENSEGHVGTGLGLGIVQSLVRLMGGDIEVIDKANGEKGTCFRFNIFLIVQDYSTAEQSARYQSTNDCQNTHSSLGRSACARSHRAEGSFVVVMIKNDERRRMVQRYIENLGIKLITIRQGNQLSATLDKIRYKILNSSQSSSSGRYLNLSSDSRKSIPLTAAEGATDSTVPVYRRILRGGSLAKCILLIIEVDEGGDFKEVSKSIARFKKEMCNIFVKVVWVDARRIHFSSSPEKLISSTDHILFKPLQGSRLAQVISLLPQFGGKMSSNLKGYSSSTRNPQSEIEEFGSSRREIQETVHGKNCDASFIRMGSQGLGIFEGGLNSHWIEPSTRDALLKAPSLNRREEDKPLKIIEVQDNVVRPKNEQSMEGVMFLIAEDNPILSNMAAKLLNRWGAGVTAICGNGKEVYEVVCKALSDMPSEGSSKLPFNCILMDCQMPIMDGFEATKRIREEEKKYKIHIPIFALTAHEAGEEDEKLNEAGMDFHLTKPLKIQELEKAIRLLKSSNTL